MARSKRKTMMFFECNNCKRKICYVKSDEYKAKEFIKHHCKQCLNSKYGKGC